jgi:hypothetical protein
MLPNEKDKENLVIDLLKKGHKTREIVKMAHVSNTTVKKIRAKLTAEAKEEQEQQGDQRKKPLSISSQAFNLFEEGKSVVEVTTGLDLTTDQILKIHSDYLTLQNRQDFVSILDANGNDLKGFLEVLHHLKENRISVKDVKEIVDIKKEIIDLKRERDRLELDNFNAEETLKYFHMDINRIQNKLHNQRY